MAEIKPTESLNFVDGNNVYIYGEFDKTIAKDVIPQLVKESENQIKLKTGRINIYIDSNGGYSRYLYNLLGLIESLKKNNVIVATYVMGCAFSCASILACSGTKEYRFISEFSQHLCHLGGTSTGITCNEVELERANNSAKAHFENIKRLYKKYAKLKDLNKAIKFDNWYIRGDDIIKNGLADRYIDK